MEAIVVVAESAEATGSIDHKEFLVAVSDDGHNGKAISAESADAADFSELKRKKNRIQVSNTKKPLFFYLNLAKRYIKQYNDVELSALGMAIPTVVTISEILKNDGLAIEKKLMISSVSSEEGERGRQYLKAKIEILLVKAQELNNTIVATA